MFEPISSLETDIWIAKEELYTQLDLEVVNGGTIGLDNRQNMLAHPYLEITFSGDISQLIITNQITNQSITITNPITKTSYLKIYHDAAYVDDNEIAADYSGLFELARNANNIIHFTVTPEVALNVSSSWVRASDTQQYLYVQGLNISHVVTSKLRTGNIYARKNYKSIVQKIDYELSIDRLWFDNYFPVNIDDTFWIKFATDDTVGGIEQRTYYLCGCSFNNLKLEQGENDLNKEGVTGSLCDVIVE